MMSKPDEEVMIYEEEANSKKMMKLRDRKGLVCSLRHPLDTNFDKKNVGPKL